MKVLKRDGRIEEYDYEKIKAAVKGAADEVGVTPPIIKISFKGKDSVTVDEIHDEVERHLMKAAPSVAKAYILYRQKRTEAREAKSSLMKKTASLIHEMNHDNANTGNSPASKMYGIAEAACKDFYLKNIGKTAAENHRMGRTYLHDLGYRNITFNCFFSPLGKMLEHGFDNGVGTIRSPKRIGTAAALTCIILQSMQNDMFGGQGILHFDTDLAPYITKEYEWQLRQIHRVNPNLSDEEADTLAWKLTDEAAYQAMEALVYNLNTMRSRSGAQVPFTSLNFGTDTSKEARMISLNLFKAYNAGLGHGENPIFPNLCYRLQDGINLHPGEPNFDITEAAIECMGNRIQPRFVFCDSPAYPDKWDAGTMGCADGDELISYEYNGTYFTESFARMWERVDSEVFKGGLSQYKKPSNLKILDGTKYVTVKTIVKNPDIGDWTRVTFSNGRSVLVTADHPLYTENRGRVHTRDLEVGDEVKTIHSLPTIPEKETMSEYQAYLAGLVITDGCYDGALRISIDRRTENDVLEVARVMFENEYGVDTKVVHRNRGDKGIYDDIEVLKPAKLMKMYAKIFGGVKKEERQIPQDIFVNPREVRLRFLAGMIDGDGHISHKSFVQIGNTNKELALQQAALAQSLGYPARIYLNHYASDERIRYRVEFPMKAELAEYIICGKKKNEQWDGHEPQCIAPDTVKVTSIESLGSLGKPSYDVETETDKFTLSFINSGNCRTAVRTNVNGDATPEARGNLAFVTMNLPMFALEAKEKGEDHILQTFREILKQATQDAIEELHDRYSIIAHLRKKDVPFVASWYQGSENLKDDDFIEPMIRNGSLSVGFIGLAETLMVLTGHHHGESEESQKLGLEIIRSIRKSTDEATKKYHLNFSTFATPKLSVGA